jgi:hypothetical protein
MRQVLSFAAFKQFYQVFADHRLIIPHVETQSMKESKNTLKKNGPSSLSQGLAKKIRKCHNNNQRIEYSYLVKTTHFLQSYSGIFGG